MRSSLGAGLSIHQSRGHEARGISATPGYTHISSSEWLWQSPTRLWTFFRSNLFASRARRAFHARVADELAQWMSPIGSVARAIPRYIRKINRVY